MRNPIPLLRPLPSPCGQRRFCTLVAGFPSSSFAVITARGDLTALLTDNSPDWNLCDDEQRIIVIGMHFPIEIRKSALSNISRPSLSSARFLPEAVKCFFQAETTCTL